MDTLMRSAEKNDILVFLLQHISLFRLFNQAYLFGSVLNENKYPEDIDLLLIYSKYSDNILDDMGCICSLLEETFHLPVDLTVLSYEELIDTDFLEKIVTYYKLK